MIILLSPSKTLDLSEQDKIKTFSTPSLLNYSKELISEFKKYSKEDIAKLMKISDKIAELNYNRFQNFKFPLTLDNSKQALLAFKGDVYKDIDVDNYSNNDVNFAQKHVRILSGLYGVLKPLDLIQPYRLEMHLKTKFWKDKVTNYFLKNVDKNEVIINLASQEYFNSVDTNKIPNRIIKIIFKELKGKDYKIIAIYAKRARGTMTNYIIKNKIENIEKLKKFNLDGYKFDDNMSRKNGFIFVRNRNE